MDLVPGEWLIYLDFGHVGHEFRSDFLDVEDLVVFVERLSGGKGTKFLSLGY